MDRQPLDLPSEVSSPSLKAKLFWETWGKLQGLECLRGSKGYKRITPKSSRTRKNLGLGLALEEFSLSNSTHTHSKFRWRLSQTQEIVVEEVGIRDTAFWVT